METTSPEGPADRDHLAVARERLIEAALPHVAFDGWSPETLKLALTETGIEPEVARLIFPRGGVDMALAFHDIMDRRLQEELSRTDMSAMKIREKVTHGVRRRIELVGEEREAVRRGATLLGLPVYAPEGAQAIWRTADIIWTAAGDSATDYNYYTKRVILASVYSATVLYWLGDETPGASNTWSFLDRRIEGVMRFEKTKAMVEANPIARAALWAPMQMLSMVRAPRSVRERQG